MKCKSMRLQNIKIGIAEVVAGGDHKTMMLSSNTIVRKSGLSFARDCTEGSAILKLNTIEDKLLSKYLKLYEILKKLQNKKEKNYA